MPKQAFKLVNNVPGPLLTGCSAYHSCWLELRAVSVLSTSSHCHIRDVYIGVVKINGFKSSIL